MQVYRGLPLLTNQSSHPTRLVGIWPLEHEASVGEFAPLAHEAIDTTLAAGLTPIVVGGTGLYLRAALMDLLLPPAPAPGTRERWERLYDEEGGPAAHARLAQLDPAAAAAVHPNDRRRVVRALELAEAGASLARGQDRLWSEETRRPTLLVGLEVAREELDRRIDERTRGIFEAGVEGEVRRALAGRISMTARKTIGLDEIATLPREQVVAAVSARTRRYAAYQRKWMRRISGLVRIDANRPPGEIADEILALGRERERLPARRAG
jgi:tRNA dimethylallyltransferase